MSISLLDPKKALFANNYMSFADLRKTSPLGGIPAGFHYPQHLAHLAFMPLGHPGMMNHFAMANHLSMRAEHVSALAAAAHERGNTVAHGPDVTSSTRSVVADLSSYLLMLDI